MKVPGIPFVQGRNDYTDQDGRKYGIAIHNTSNDATAENEASYATRRTDGISAHFYVDNDSIIQSLDTGDKAGHAGSYNGNENAIAVEITGTNDKSRAWWLENVAWDKLGYTLASVCKYYGIDVRRASVSEMKSNPKVKAFYSHNDMRLAWDGTTHTDPGPNFPWDRLFQAVNAHMDGAGEMELTDKVDLVTGKDVDYSSSSTTVEGVLSSTNYYVLQSRNATLSKLNAIESRITTIESKISTLVAPAPITDEQLERVLRKVMGSVDNV